MCLLAAFKDDFLDKQPRHRKIHRTNCNQSARALAVEGGKTVGLLRPVGAQNQIQEGRFLRRELLILLLVAQIRVDTDEVLAFIFAEVENCECTVVLALGLKLPLHSNHAFACCMDRKLAKIANDPLAT